MASMTLDLPAPVGPVSANRSTPSKSTTVRSRNVVKPSSSSRAGLTAPAPPAARRTALRSGVVRPALGLLQVLAEQRRSAPACRARRPSPPPSISAALHRPRVAAPGRRRSRAAARAPRRPDPRAAPRAGALGGSRPRSSPAWASTSASEPSSVRSRRPEASAVLLDLDRPSRVRLERPGRTCGRRSRRSPAGAASRRSGWGTGRRSPGCGGGGRGPRTGPMGGKAVADTP